MCLCKRAGVRNGFKANIGSKESQVKLLIGCLRRAFKVVCWLCKIVLCANVAQALLWDCVMYAGMCACACVYVIHDESSSLFGPHVFRGVFFAGMPACQGTLSVTIPVATVW
jgi:hypothetical protein